MTSILLNNIEDYPKREVVVNLSNGAQVHIVACHESFEAFGGTEEDMRAVTHVADEYNDWLHPYTAENFYEVAESLCDGLDHDVWEIAALLAEKAQEEGWSKEKTDDLCTADSTSMFDVLFGKDFNESDFVCS